MTPRRSGSQRTKDRILSAAPSDDRKVVNSVRLSGGSTRWHRSPESLASTAASLVSAAPKQSPTARKPAHGGQMTTAASVAASSPTAGGPAPSPAPPAPRAVRRYRPVPAGLAACRQDSP